MGGKTKLWFKGIQYKNKLPKNWEISVCLDLIWYVRKVDSKSNSWWHFCRMMTYCNCKLRTQFVCIFCSKPGNPVKKRKSFAHFWVLFFNQIETFFVRNLRFFSLEYQLLFRDYCVQNAHCISSNLGKDAQKIIALKNFGHKDQLFLSFSKLFPYRSAIGISCR